MRGKKWFRRWLLLALAFVVLGLAADVCVPLLARAWARGVGVARPEEPSEADGHWLDGPLCLSPSRPYLCLLEFRLRMGAGLPFLKGWAAALPPLTFPADADRGD